MKYISLSNGLSHLRDGKMHLSIWLSCLGLGTVPAISLLWYVCFYSLSSRIRSVERARSCILSRTSGDQMHPGALAYPFSLAWSGGDKLLFLDSWIILGSGILSFPNSCLYNYLISIIPTLGPPILFNLERDVQANPSSMWLFSYSIWAGLAHPS